MNILTRINKLEEGLKIMATVAEELSIFVDGALLRVSEIKTELETNVLPNVLTPEDFHKEADKVTTALQDLKDSINQE